MMLAMVSCDLFRRPDVVINPDPLTIPGNAPKALYRVWEVEGITYYTLSSGAVICPATDRAIQELANK